MTETFILTVARVEGEWDINKCELSVAVDGNDVNTCFLNSLPANFSISVPGVITIDINDKNSKSSSASLAFQTSLLHSEWFYWLPLFKESDNFLVTLPPKISQPRVLLGVQKELQKSALTDTSEHEKEETLNPQNDSFQDQSFINQKPSDQSFYIKEDNERLIKFYQNLVQDLEQEIHNQKDIVKQSVQDLQAQISSLKQQLELEKNYSISLQEKLSYFIDIGNVMKKSEEGFFKSFGEKSFDIEPQESVGIIKQRQFYSHRHSQSQVNDNESFEKSMERKVYETLNRLNLVGLMRRTRELNFLIGAKTITLCMKNGEVVCKNGVGLDSYIFKHCSSEIENFLRLRIAPSMRKSASSRSPSGFHKSRKLDTQ
ncbi:hypothetical protein SteCoe_12307 [Stentor coeruleus]|uniref:Uncharacterized protein n=1 Tax=Stentor coeruleus TaxID=5963 RepID=A0A1R2CB78_9CILI|nr:hypothetical protein SteCoe_12307 [Stentor coeruleus]